MLFIIGQDLTLYLPASTKKLAQINLKQTQLLGYLPSVASWRNCRRSTFQLMSSQEKQLIIKAINDLGRKVSIADVASKTGLPLLLTTTELNKVASETGGHLLVSTAGDIAYHFDLGFQNSYLAHGIKRFFSTLTEQVFHLAFLLVRISFGIMLILSLVTIVVIIGLIMLYLNKDNDRDDGGGFNFDLFDFLILQDLFRWNTYPSYPTYQTYERPAVRTNSNGNFLFNCFSFLFGDGNPNLHLEEQRWQLIAQAINNHGGMITAEQLAPYTDSDPKNEDAVLPVLVRFDGRPEVSDSGNIIYVFPALAVSALKTTEPTHSSLPAFLSEWPWKFSNLPDDAFIPVVILAAINFLGSWWLLFETVRLPILARLAPLIVLLVAYGTLFVLVPVLRLLTINYLNARIEKRNTRRRQRSEELKHPSAPLAKKLQESQQFAIKKRQITDKDIVYRTDEDLLSQEIEK